MAIVLFSVFGRPVTPSRRSVVVVDLLGVEAAKSPASDIAVSFGVAPW